MRDINHLLEHLKKAVETGEPFFPQEHDIEILERYSTSSDLINREDAIDELRHLIPYKKYHRGEWVYLLDKREVFKAINTLPSAEAEWIPCSDRLPSEKDGQILVTKHDEVRIATYSEFSGTWYVGEMYAVGGEDPIAWMLLPKPYRKDGE